MFGHHNDNSKDDSNPVADSADTTVTPDINLAAVEGAAPEQAAASPEAAVETKPEEASSTDSTTSPSEDWQHPGTPIEDKPAVETPDTSATTEPISDVLSPAGGFPRSTTNQFMNADSYTPHLPGSDTGSSISNDGASSSDDSAAPTDSTDAADTGTDMISIDEATIKHLISIKHHALEELLPLIDKLDQSPEERFRILMMMIQASDNQELIDKAYDAAHGITDDSVRAQALLDIVNEINYFTAQKQADTTDV